jgi:hypothetical protein
MNSYFLALLATLAISTIIRSQDDSLASTTETAVDSEISITSPRILGNIPDGTPPRPAPPKAPFIVPATKVLQTTTHEQGGRTITVREIKPIALPPPSTPVESPATEPDQEFTERLDAYRAAHPSSELLFISVTVFRSEDSPPRTLVRYWPQSRGKNITFWSSADFGLIVGGIQSFADSSAGTYHLVMGWGYDQTGTGPPPQSAPHAQGTVVALRTVNGLNGMWFIGGYKQTPFYNQYPNIDGNPTTVLSGHYFIQPAGTSDDGKYTISPPPAPQSRFRSIDRFCGGLGHGRNTRQNLKRKSNDLCA